MLKRWKIVLLLSVIVPMGLLITFRLGGILRKPPEISENKTLEAVSWSLERPIANIEIDDSRMRIYSEDILVNSTVFIDDYDAGSWAYGGSDYITMQIDITSSISEGFISFINITFWENYESSQINFFGDDAWPKYFAYVENLSITRHHDSLGEYGSGLKAFVELAGVNNPKSVSFGCCVNWILRSPQNYTHQMEVRFELIYFNRTAYKRIAQPLLLKIGPDDNNSPETASEITVGTCSKFYIGPNDVNDYYKIDLNEGCITTIQLSRWTDIPIANCDLELYDPYDELVAYSKHNCTHIITYPINSSGHWLIRVHWLAGFGFYTLTLETSP